MVPHTQQSNTKLHQLWETTIAFQDWELMPLGQLLMGLDVPVPLPTEIHADPAAPIKHGGKRSAGEDAEYPNAVATNVPRAVDKYLFFELHIIKSNICN